MSSDSSYVPLWTKSAYAFLDGASTPQEYVEEARRVGLTSLAIVDRDGVHGAVAGHLAARDAGVHLVHGSEITVEGGATIVLLVEDREGWANLCRLATKGRLRCEKGRSSVTWEEVCSHAKGLVALWHGRREGEALAAPGEEALPALRDAYGNALYALATRHRRAEETAREASLRAIAARFTLPVAAANEVLYHSPSRRDLQDVMTCIRHGTTLDKAGRLLKPNSEHALLPPAMFASLFADDPAAIRRTLEVAARCTFSLAELRYRYPSERLPDGTTSSQWLRHLAFTGAASIYGGSVPADVREQLDKELGVIDRLDYPGYFLTMYEIVRFCREKQILCQGRGSAANSAVCFCLGVTAVDPVRMGLLFERFLSLERAEPPDIDLDIEHERREEVIQHVYAKYGRQHAAMVAVTIRYRPRSALRDVGKALGLAETTLDRIAKTMSSYEPLTAEALEAAGLNPRTRTVKHLVRIANELLDFPRHLSIHPGGFLLGHEPVHDIVPIENGSMPDRTVIQWDKDDVEAVGLFKVDLLGLGALHQIHLCLDLLRKHRGVDLSMATIPAQDEPTFEMIRRADTVGTFQIESRAQMSMLPRLLPRTFYDLVIEVSIVRPGPITGGMVHPYLRRRSGEEEVVYPHPCLEPVLRKTLGVPLFQEQVMRLAIVAADYTPGEADQLRRDMAAWRSIGRLEHHHERLVSRMTAKGIEPEFAERVFQQIRGFGEYGFPESHAASFALISYATSYLKCHHPAEFACSMLNAQPMGFYSPATLIEDAKRHGVVVRPVCVNASAWDCTLEDNDNEFHHGGTEARRGERDGPGSSSLPSLIERGERRTASQDERPSVTPRLRGDVVVFAVRIGLRYVKGLGKRDGELVAKAKAARPFASIDDFVRRVPLSEDRLRVLAEAGTFDAFGLTRREALWAALGAARAAPPSPLPVQVAEEEPAFAGLDAFETIGWDYRTQHLSVRGHPLEPLRERMTARRLPEARAVNAMPHGRRVRYAGIVICRQRPATASGVVFMTLEDETGFVNLVVWTRVFADNALLLKTASFLGVTGKLQVEKGVTHLVAETFFVPDLGPAPQTGGSRDFH